MANFPNLEKLYTPRSLFTIAGAPTAVWLFCGTSSHVFGFNPRWLGLVVAESIAFLGMTMLSKAATRNAILIVVTFFNGLVIYSTTVGINAFDAATDQEAAKAASLLGFIDSQPWWPPAKLAAEVEAAKEREARTLEALDNVDSGLRELEAQLPDIEADRPLLAPVREAINRARYAIAAPVETTESVNAGTAR